MWCSARCLGTGFDGGAADRGPVCSSDLLQPTIGDFHIGASPSTHHKTTTMKVQIKTPLRVKVTPLDSGNPTGDNLVPDNPPPDCPEFRSLLPFSCHNRRLHKPQNSKTWLEWKLAHRGWALVEGRSFVRHSFATQVFVQVP